MSDTTSSKTKHLFWLNRMRREREDAVTAPSHETMARLGVSYDARRAKGDAAEKMHAKIGPEIEALTFAIAIVEGSA